MPKMSTEAAHWGNGYLTLAVQEIEEIEDRWKQPDESVYTRGTSDMIDWGGTTSGSLCIPVSKMKERYIIPLKIPGV